MRPDLAAAAAVALVVVTLVAVACGPSRPSGASGEPGRGSIVVTTAVLGSVVEDLVGDRADVTVLMGNGVDPHDWSPSAKDIERVTKADLVVANGLGLEGGLERTLQEAEKGGVPVFRATDHIAVRHPPEGDPAAGEASGGGDPHFWVDPISMQAVVRGLVPELTGAGIDVAERGADLEQRLAALDAEIRGSLDEIPEARRKLVTGHESMGYFADRYGFELVGTVVPGLSSQGEVSAGELAALRTAIEEQGVPAIFTEVGTPAAVVEAIGRETGAKVVELPSHTLPDDGSYFTFVRRIAAAIGDGFGSPATSTDP